MSAVAGHFDVALESAVLPARPYPGIRPFGVSEWAIFFGRERMTDEIVHRLIDQQFLLVHGDSGCGKSSLIYAGVMPRLLQESSRGGWAWKTCVATPGRDPLGNLAAALASLDASEGGENREFELRHLLTYGRKGGEHLARYLNCGPDNHVCLLLDQFEELFAYHKANPSGDARDLVELLIGLKERPQSGLYIVATMRSEFLGACAKFEGFAEAINERQYLLPRMSGADLTRAIREPARLFGGVVSMALADRLIEDAGTSGDLLPLVQHTLMSMHRELAGQGAEPGWRLEVDQYQELGGNLEAVLSRDANRVASEVTACLPKERGNLVEEVFRALARITDDGHSIRWPQPLDRLIAITGAAAAEVHKVVDAFRADGVFFLRPYGAEPLKPYELINISHEALLRCWDAMAKPGDGWLIKEFRSGLTWRSLLEDATSDKRKADKLLPPATAQVRNEWIGTRSPAWSEQYGGQWDVVKDLIKASLDAKKRATFARFGLIGIAIVSVVLSLAFIFATNQERQRARLVAEVAAEKNFVLQEQLATRNAELKRADEEQKFGELKARLTEALETEESPEALRKELQAIAQQTDSAGAVKLAPRVYFYIGNEAQKSEAEALARQVSGLKLDTDTVVVPRITLRDFRDGTSELRCFSDDDCAEAERLLVSVNNLLSSPKIERRDLTEQVKRGVFGDTPPRPRHFELWFVSGARIVVRSEGVSATQEVDPTAPRPIEYSQAIVDTILRSPGVPFPPDMPALEAAVSGRIKAIILHTAYAPDGSINTIRDGRPGLPGPLAHWVVQSNGTIVFVAPETTRANHVGRAIEGVNNGNTIGVETTGYGAFADPRQVENLVRLVANIADRWGIPTSLILSHAEVAMPTGHKADMRQQAPAVRQMVEAVREKKSPQ